MAEDPRAVYWLILAGRGAASTGAYQVAAERFERAIALIARDPERDGERAWLLCELAEARRYSDTRQALRHLERAIEIAISPTEPDAALLALARLSHARIRDFRNESALDALQAARAAYDALQPTEQARIAASPLQYVTNLGTYAQWLAVHGRYSDALTAAEQYLDGHPDLDGDQQTTGHAWYATALASAALGQPDRARSAFARARARYGEASNAHMVGMMLDWELDTVLCVYAADQPAERQSAVRELRRLTLDSTTTAAQQFAADLLDGRWAEARIAAEATVGLDSLRFYRARVLCELDWQQGHAERAWAHINSVFRDGPATEPGTRLFHNLLHIQRVAAELALDAGRPEIARQWIDANERWMDWSGQLAGRPRALALRACLAEIQGKDAQARRLAEAALELASQPRQALIMIEAELILGRLSLQAGRLEEAEQHVVAALALAERCAAPWEIARARIARVEQHIAAGQIEPAREHLHATHAIAARLEARPLMERVDALDAGSRANVTQSIAPGGLSGRELEVLRLVARGLTNAEIASELFISPRTVEQHLRRIYVKIDARSRSAATRFAIEHGIG
jgi:DNA-binding CsgD family transcriptional regulator/tetratricopeptide (TPR) repeat protein